MAIIFDLLNNNTYSDVANALSTGDLRIGLHVRSIAGGGSDSFVAMVPLPATILLGFLGLGIGGWKLRKSLV